MLARRQYIEFLVKYRSLITPWAPAITPSFFNQTRFISNMNPLPVVRIPVTMTEKLKGIQSRRKKKELSVLRSQKGKRAVPIISCKRQELNHNLGQTYSKFQVVPLASKGWSHRKSAGDYFTINSFAGNPAFGHLAEGGEDSFKDLGLTSEIQMALSNIGFETPTNIQALAIPQVLVRNNALITAETGNGKTIAFLAPTLQMIAKSMASLGPRHPLNAPLGLIIVPGRELAEQIYSVASSLAEAMEGNICVELLVGGRTKKRMLDPKVSKAHLLVATIGALSKLTTARHFDLSYVRHIILDEADTLLDDSFNDDVTRYLSRFPIQRGKTSDDTEPLILSGAQLIMVGATTPRSVHTILDSIVEMDSLVRISTPYLHQVMPHIPQKFLRVNHTTKLEKLLELAKKDLKNGTPFIVFSNSAKTSDWVSLFLNENNIPCVNLNNKMPAIIRKGRFNIFQSASTMALSCTDLTSRGLDTIRAGHVINYEFPKFIADYIHRCGRVGRVGSITTGHVTNLVHRPVEIELVQKIEYAARKQEELHNVNANIKRILNSKITHQELELK